MFYLLQADYRALGLGSRVGSLGLKGLGRCFQDLGWDQPIKSKTLNPKPLAYLEGQGD